MGLEANVQMLSAKGGSPMNLFFGVHEVRMRRPGGTATGYFNSEAAALQTIENEPSEYIAAWFTLNPLRPRPGIELNPSVLKTVSTAAADADVERRSWLLIDCDPQRPANTNSTEAEKQESRKQVDAVRNYLRDRGWPEPVLADSGNGWHLLYRIDLPNDEAATETVRAALGRLAQIFNTGASKVDAGNYNAARLCKVYGSWSRKGEHSVERPRRRSAVIECPDVVTAVPVELLELIAHEYQRKAKISLNDVKLLKLVGFLEHYSVPMRSRPRSVKGGWSIEVACPWVNEHSGESHRETEVSHISGIGFGFKCFHAHCADRHWREFRHEVENQNPSTPPYFGKSDLPKLVHSEVARSFVADTEDFVCVYDQNAETAAWVNTRWTIGDKGDYLLRRALRDYLNQLYPLYPEPDNPKQDPRRTLLQSPFLSHVLTEVRPLLPKKSIKDFDAEPWLLAGPDGQVTDLTTGRQRMMRREDCLTQRINVIAVPGPTPRWDKFLEEVTVGDKDLAEYIVRLCGLCLSGHPEQILVFFWGGGRNGKGVLLRLLAKLLGPYAVTLRPNEVTYAKEDGDRMKRTFAKLAGKRLAVVNESVGKRLNVSALKLLSGGDTISGARMRQDDSEYTPNHKLILVSNDRPDLPADPAIRGRLHFVPFLGDFSGDKGDRFVEDKLWAEREGILHWLILGCVATKQSGLQPPTSVRAATDELMEELDTTGQFIADRVTRGTEDDFVPKDDVEDAIRSWLPGNVFGDDWRATRILNDLKSRFRYARKRLGAGPRPWGFYGIRLEAPGS
jgi:P4 family phage/plasmid primase-like protien